MSIQLQGCEMRDFIKIEEPTDEDTRYEDWKFEQAYEPMVSAVYGEDC